MLRSLFKQKDTDIYLLNQSDFNGRYQLIVETEFKMGAENPPIQIKNTSNLELSQTILSSAILTSINVLDSKTETENLAFRESLKEVALFTEIILQIEVKRDIRGVFSKIQNMPTLHQNWIRWRDKNAEELFPNPLKRKKIISNFENGLKQLEFEFNNNFQYTLLLPECYKYRDYYNPKDIGSVKSYKSRLVEGLRILYRMKKNNFKIKDDTVLFNQIEIIQNDYSESLIDFYKENLPDFTPEQYQFGIKTKYKLNKHSSKILKAEMLFREELHPNYHYNIKFQLDIV